MQLRREGNRETEGSVELLCGHSCHLRVETGLAFSAVNSGESDKAGVKADTARNISILL